MRGLKISGTVLVGLLVLGSVIPSSVNAQGTSADQYLAYGNKLYSARSYQKAIQYYNYAAKMSPSNAAAYQGMGYCYYALGNKQYALAYCQKALQLNPNNSQLAQFVSGLQAQTGAAAPAAGGMAAGDPLSQGTALFQQKQYSSAIPYFQQATQQNPNDYRAFYYAGYSYYMMGDGKDAALYFQIANVKQPNASIKAYADRVKASLSAADQQWVDDQVSKYTGVAVASGAGGNKSQSGFGFRIIGGMDYVFADPSQIINGATAAKTVGLSGVTPNVIALPGIEPFAQLGQNFELDMNVSYLPIGNLSYTWNDLGGAYAPNPAENNGGSGYGWKYSYDDTGLLVGLGVKVLFGDSSVKGYFGVGGDLAPISMSFSKVPIDPSGNPTTVDNLGNPVVAENGNYSTMAFGGHAKLGVDFYLDKSIALGPWVGFQYLSASSFQSSGKTLSVDPANGDVDGADATHTQVLTLDYTSINGGLNLTFTF